MFGFLTWLIPFAVSFLFYSKDGLIIDIFLFKSIMIVVGAVSAAFLLIIHFKKIDSAFLREGIVTGIMWLTINLLLDLLILLPMSKMPVMSILPGKALADHDKNK